MSACCDSLAGSQLHCTYVSKHPACLGARGYLKEADTAILGGRVDENKGGETIDAEELLLGRQYLS